LVQSHTDDSLSVIPKPQSVTIHPGRFIFDQQTSIIVDEETSKIGTFLAGMLKPATGFPLPIRVDNEIMSRSVRLDAALIEEEVIATDLDRCNCIILSMNSDITNPEGYMITVAAQRVHIQGSTAAGLFYAVQTLRQMLPTQIDRSSLLLREWSIPQVQQRQT
jgi:hexosaminidase